MTYGPITSWQIEWEKVEAVRDFIFLDSKALWTVTAAMKLRHLLLGRKAMTNLDNILKKQRHHFANKFRLIKAMVFPVVMYGCESSTIKKAECRRIDAFELWCCRRLVKSPLGCKINPLNPKEISPEYSFKRLMLKLKL